MSPTPAEPTRSCKPANKTLKHMANIAAHRFEQGVYFWPCQQKDTVFWGFVLGRVHAGQGGGHSSEKLERKNKSKRYKLATRKGTQIVA